MKTRTNGQTGNDVAGKKKKKARDRERWRSSWEVAYFFKLMHTNTELHHIYALEQKTLSPYRYTADAML